MAFNTGDLDKGFEIIKIDEFSFNKEIMGYSWTRTKANRIERVMIGYGGYPDSFKIYTPVVNIYFSEVENVFEKFKKEHCLNKFTGNSTIQKSFYKLPNVDSTKLKTEIKDLNTFNEVAIELKKIIEDGALPFFEKFNNVNAVFEESEKMAREELRNFIVQPLPQRRMVIKKLCNDPNYQDYTTRLIDYYKSEKDDDLKEIEDLDDFLKSMV
jgi:hypothetical protein